MPEPRSHPRISPITAFGILRYHCAVFSALSNGERGNVEALRMCWWLMAFNEKKQTAREVCYRPAGGLRGCTKMSQRTCLQRRPVTRSIIRRDFQ